MDKYIIIKTLRKKSESEVVVVQDPLGQLYILKIVQIIDPEEGPSVLNEVGLFQSLDHPFII